MSQEQVNHPSHYTRYQGMEVIDLTRQMGFNLGNAVKYIARAGLKDARKEVEDLQKAIFYIEDEIKWTNHDRVSYEKYGEFVGILARQLPFCRSAAVYHICSESTSDLKKALNYLREDIEWTRLTGSPKPY